MFELFLPRGNYAKAWGGHVLVLSPGEIPTLDYYARARLDRLEGVTVSYCNALAAQPDVEHVAGAFVIIVRHANTVWLDFLWRHREQWSGVAYLMDDDIPSAWRCRDIPLDYALWTSGRYVLARRSLARVCDRIWVSTPELQNRYVRQGALLVPPLCPDFGWLAAPAGCRRWGYHGTRVHQRELRWLRPVVEAVQAAVPDAEFEVFGDGRIEKIFAGIPRVRVLRPRPWPDYLAYCRLSRLAVSLAPLLPGRFNAARSHSKLFDILRCGAVGVFSEVEPYAGVLADAGVCMLANDHEPWCLAIQTLLTDDGRRLEMYQQVSKWVSSQQKAVIIPPPFE